MVREREEAGGVSVQFTNTTVNSEAGQDTERAGGRSEKETPGFKNAIEMQHTCKCTKI